MRFSTVAFTSASISAALAATYNVKLYADSSDSSVNGLGLSSTHEGAGINYFFLGSNAEDLTYDDEANTLTSTLSTQTVSVSVLGEFLSLSVAKAADITVNDDAVSVNGTSNFFAAKNVNDPYNLSAGSYAVVNESADGAIPITIKLVKDGSSSSSSAVASSTVVTSTTASATSSAPAVTETSNGASQVGAGAAAAMIAGAALLL